MWNQHLHPASPLPLQMQSENGVVQLSIAYASAAVGSTAKQKNSIVTLNSRNDMIFIHQRSAWTSEHKISLISSDGVVLNGFIMFVTTTPLESSAQLFYRPDYFSVSFPNSQFDRFTNSLWDLEMFFPMTFVWWFVFLGGPRTFSAWLPLCPLWAIFVICINPRWPPADMTKINFESTWSPNDV